jgi:glycosyltransferase involved in cell wall biosynthesis
MSRPPRISVIVPAFNTAAYIGEAIESVRRQTVSDWELIVVDDGSTDGTAEAAEGIAEPRLRLIRQANAGVSAARNRGAAEARGEFFLFLDSDDRLRPDALERLGAFLAAHPDADMAYGELATTGEDGRLRHGGRPVFGPRPSGRILSTMLAGGFMVTGMALMRAEAFRRSGGFDESLRLSQDWEFLCRMAAWSEILYLPGPPVLEYRLRSSSATHLLGGGDAGFAERMRAIDRAYGNPAVTGGFPPGELARLRRRRDANLSARVGTQALRGRDWATARRFFWKGLRYDPARPREIILLMFALLRWLPPAVERRLK